MSTNLHNIDFGLDLFPEDKPTKQVRISPVLHAALKKDAIAEGKTISRLLSKIVFRYYVEEDPDLANSISIFDQ